MEFLTSRFIVPFMRLRLLAVLAVATGMATVPAVSAAQVPDYSQDTVTRFIPFAAWPDTSPCARPGTQPFTCPLRVRALIRGQSRLLTMDTGSTGIVLSANLIPGYSPNASNSVGWEFLSSSKLLWTGHWVPMDVTFHDRAGTRVVSHVRVLALEQEVRCPGWQVSDGARCPHPVGRPTSPALVRYLGVGFGREYNGQPQGTPDKNPFINVTSIGGVPVRPGSMRGGYVITERGVHLGLTAGNTTGFTYVKLALQPNPADGRDWNQAPMCVQVADSECASGYALVDTGIPQMYLSADSVRMDTVMEPDLSDTSLMVPALAPRSRVTVRWRNGQTPVAHYTFTVGDTANSMRPAQAIRVHDGFNFVNTGRHFLNGFDVLYDADGGWYGLRWTGRVDSKYGGVTAGSR